VRRASDAAEHNLSERTVHALLCFRSNFLNRHHFTAFGRATKHDARASGADELARSQIFGEDEAMLQQTELGVRANHNMHCRLKICICELMGEPALLTAQRTPPSTSQTYHSASARFADNLPMLLIFRRTSGGLRRLGSAPHDTVSSAVTF
jgi:hypothetical protein